MDPSFAMAGDVAFSPWSSLVVIPFPLLAPDPIPMVDLLMPTSSLSASSLTSLFLLETRITDPKNWVRPQLSWNFYHNPLLLSPSRLDGSFVFRDLKAFWSASGRFTLQTSLRQDIFVLLFDVF